MRELLDRACRGHWVLACDALIESLPRENQTKAIWQLRIDEAVSGCANDVADACLVLAQLEARNVARWTQACSLGSLPACEKRLIKDIATDYEDLTAHRERANALVKRRCDEGNAAVCWNRYQLLDSIVSASEGDDRLDEHVRAVTGDPPSSMITYREKALAAWNRDCVAGWVPACIEAAWGLRTERDPALRARVTGFAQRACALGDAASCKITP